MMKSGSLSDFFDRVGHGDLGLDAAAAVIATGFRNHEHDLARPLAQRVLDAGPRRCPARKIKDVGPDLVTKARQPRYKPTDELVIVRSGMTNEDVITFLPR